jgi:nucleoside-diphosphate-sugar epimerase
MTTFLRAAGHAVNPVTRDGIAALLADRRPAGEVIDCIGLTGDFRTQPLATAEAHVAIVARVLERVDLISFLYLSSTRLYARTELGREDMPIAVQPAYAGDVYNITKLAGEALCLSDRRPTVRVARLSNVYGPGMSRSSFLGDVLAEGRAHGRVLLRQSLRSTKDYIGIGDTVALLHAIATNGQARLYNVASGANTSHDAIAGVLTRQCGWHIDVAPDAAAWRVPRIDVQRIAIEFGPPRNGVLDDLPALAGPPRQEVAC